MRRRDLLAGSAAAIAAGATGGLAKPAIAQKASLLRFVPQANLANPDPIWTTATVAINHGYMVWDTLYGIDNALSPKPQMAAGHELSDNDKTWTITLRDGLLWHDNTPVRAIDAATSIQRWWVKDPFGQQLHSLTDEIKPLDDKRLQIRLKRPFPQLPYALGAQQCFIMPDRMAQTPASQQIKEFIGSGPFRFIATEWVSGSKAVYEKFDKYVPRQEPPQYLSGGKIANFNRVEWVVEPDPSTAASALQTGEVDWIEQPLIDLLPMLKQNANLVVETFDPLGSLAIIAFNHLYPPFDNPKVLQALLPAVNQKEYMQSVVGEQESLAKYPVGFFTAGSPMANDAGLDVLSGPRDINKAKQLLQESGYKGEPVMLMSPSDQAALQQMAQVTFAMFKAVGLNAQLLTMDWGTLVARRAKQDPPSQGGWNSFCTSWGGLSVSNPGSSYPLRGNGRAGWFGWPTNPDIESLRQQWFDAPDLAAQKNFAQQIQLAAFKNLPFMPTGQYFSPTSYRNDLTGFVKCAQILFWGVRRS
jgi:peptide/nickel transport system substrate-binding protein